LDELLETVYFTLHGLRLSRRAIIDYRLVLRLTNTSNNERVRPRSLAIVDAKSDCFGFFSDWEDSARLYGEGRIFPRWQTEP
jgi:hypothetical protein